MSPSWSEKCKLAVSHWLCSHSSLISLHHLTKKQALGLRVWYNISSPGKILWILPSKIVHNLECLWFRPTESRAMKYCNREAPTHTSALSNNFMASSDTIPLHFCRSVSLKELQVVTAAYESILFLHLQLMWVWCERWDGSTYNIKRSQLGVMLLMTHLCLFIIQIMIWDFLQYCPPVLPMPTHTTRTQMLIIINLNINLKHL